MGVFQALRRALPIETRRRTQRDYVSLISSRELIRSTFRLRAAMLWSRRRLSSCTLRTCFRSEMISPSTVTRRSRISVLPSLSSR